MQAGLSQDLLSEKAGIFRTYLSRVESGAANPTLLVLVALAQALRVHPGELFK
jgi:transcriptional regulator with XRE-family HTH domain